MFDNPSKLAAKRDAKYMQKNLDLQEKGYLMLD